LQSFVAIQPNVEIGGYNNVFLENRKCSFCHNIGIYVVEDEMHVLLHCPLYIDLRQHLYFKACQRFINFNSVEDVEKISILLNEETILNCSAKCEESVVIVCILGNLKLYHILLYINIVLAYEHFFYLFLERLY
jgi:hypothetical protein